MTIAFSDRRPPHPTARCWRLLALAVLAIGACAPSIKAPASPGRPSAPALAPEALLGGDARDAFALAEAARARGKALYESQRFDEAIAAFAAGYEAAPWPVFLFNIGQARKQLGDCRAVFSFRRFLREVERLAPTDPARTAAEAGIPVAQRNLAALQGPCAAAMRLPAHPRPRHWYERRATLTAMLGGVTLMALGAGALGLGERAAQQAHRATSLDEAATAMDRARLWRLGGAALGVVGVGVALGSYLHHRAHPSLLDEITVEVSGRAALASWGGRF